MTPDALFFASAAEFRAWLEQNGEQAQEVWVGYWKKGSGRSGMTYVESVDEALCFGWIDGLTKSIDDARYATRFTPRRASGNWSVANIKRVAELNAEARMTPAGLRAFEARREPAPGTYTYETRPNDLPEEYAAIFRRNESAWSFWTTQRPAYRRSMTWWVVSAKRDETRLRRLEALIEETAAGRVLDDLHLPKLGSGRSDG
jgi:uncharacterized protein YdeI (YjbR/CyaY-like superfamily)